MYMQMIYMDCVCVYVYRFCDYASFSRNLYLNIYTDHIHVHTKRYMYIQTDNAGLEIHIFLCIYPTP